MKRAAVIIAAIMFLTASFIGADAQTRRRKPRPLATPVPTLTDAQIISQAGDNPDPDQVQPQPTETPKKASTTSTRLSDLDGRVKRLEGGAPAADPDAKQKRMLLNLQILNGAEQRAENLRKQVFEMIDKENAVQKRLDEIAYQIQPAVIEHELQMSGSMRPEEVRENRRKQLAAEQTTQQALLTQVQATRASLEAILAKADDMVEKLRTKLEKDINESFLNDDQAPDKPDDQQL
jgi:hypothetical protein